MTITVQVPATFYSWEGRVVADSGNRMSSAYHIAVLAVAVVLIYTNLPIYAYVLSPSLLPKYMYFGLFALMAPLVLMKHRLVAEYLCSPFALWASMLLVLNLIHLSNFAQVGAVGGADLVDVRMEARQDRILARTQYIAFAFILGFSVYACARKSYLRAATALALLLPCAVMLDFFLPGRIYPLDTQGAVLGRAAAMFINPNIAGEVLLHVFLLACVATSPRYRAPLFILTGLAIAATFSRAAMLAWAAIFLILVCTKTLPKSAILMTALALGLFLFSQSTLEHYVLSRSELEDASGNILARLDFFSSLAFDDDSAIERAAVLDAGWRLFLQNPVFGAGSGATLFWSERASTHNQLLLFAAEYGIFGIGLWIWMLVLVWRGRFFEDRGLQLAMVFLFGFMSMFTHAMFDSDFHWLASLALVSARTSTLRDIRWRLGQRTPPRECTVPVAFDWAWAATRRINRPVGVSK